MPSKGPTPTTKDDSKVCFNALKITPKIRNKTCQQNSREKSFVVKQDKNFLAVFWVKFWARFWRHGLGQVLGQVLGQELGEVLGQKPTRIATEKKPDTCSLAPKINKIALW